MANNRKGSKYELDDYGFSNDLDIPDFGAKDPKSSDDRKPVTKFAKGALSGARTAATSPAFAAKVMKSALPKGYGQAIDFADETAGSIRSLYDNASKEIRPAVNDLKRYTQRVMPQGGSKFLPKSVANRIKKWSQDIEGSSGSSVDAQRDSAVAMQLGEIFGAQTQLDAQRDAESDAKDKIKEGIAQARHRDQLSQLDAIRRGVQQSNAYMTGANAKFQRKSLELQFRQFFVAKDTLEEVRRFNSLAQQQLEDIKKNTGLPDFVKLNHKEAFDQAMRNKFIGMLADGVFSRRSGFAKRMMSNLGQMVMGKARSVATGISQAVSMANSATDMAASMSDMGVDPAHMVGQMVGEGGTMASAGWLGRRLAPLFAKNKKLVKFGNKLDHGMSNMPQILGEWAKSGKGMGKGPMRDFFVGFAKDWINQSLGGTDTKMQKDSHSNLMQPMPYNRHAHKSLTEIIPGFLARIFRELQVIRTGNDSIELTTYDYHANRFSSKSKTAKNAVGKMMNNWSRRATQEQLDGFISKIDPSKKLTPEQRKELSLKLLRDNMNNRYGGGSRMSDAASYGDSKHGELYASLFRDHLKDDHLGVRNNALTEQFNKLGGWIGDSRAQLQQHINAGGLGDLHDAGLVNRHTGELDLERIYRYQLGEDFQLGKQRGRRGRGKVPGFAAGGLHAGGASVSGEFGPELKVSGPARFYSKNETEQMLRRSGIKDHRNQMLQSLQDIAGTVKRIEEQLHVGIPAFSAEDWMDASGNKLGRGVRGLKDRAKSLAEHLRGKVKRRLGDRTLGEMGRGAWSSARAMGSSAWGMARSLGGGLWNTGVGAGKMAWGKGSAGAKAFYEEWKDKADVYVKGEVLPRLTAWKLKAGLYKDQATGKVITKFKDITSSVVDEHGNVVLSYDEAKEAFIKTGLGTKVLAGLTSIKEGAKSLIKGIGNQLPGIYGMVMGGARKAWNFLVNHPQDVYVKGRMDKAALRAAVMAAGGYFSKATGKLITHPGQIDGAVLDSEGNEALSADEIKIGLVDRFGMPLRTRLSRLFGAGMNLAQTVAKLLGRGAKGLWNLVKGAGGKFSRGLGNLTQGLFPGFGGMGGMGDGEDTVGLLTQIRDLLDARLPGGGLMGGNGLDIDLNDLERQGGKGATQAEQAAAKGGRMSRMGAAIKGSRVGRWAGGAKNALMATRVGGAAAGMFGRAGGALARGAGALGRLGGGALGAAGKFAGRFLGPLGAGLGAYSAYQNFKQGNYGMAALDAGLGAASLAGSGAMLGGLATGAGAVAGAVGTGLAAAGAGALGLLASPVVLGALAVGAVAGAGYLGYKYFTRKTLGKLSKLRYAQYGFAENDKDHLSLVFGLEDRLEDAIKWGATGPQLDGSKVDIKKIYDDFGIDERHPEQVARFLGWFQKRFKPVFLTHVAALRAAAADKKLGDVDSLKGAEAKRYVNLARFDGGPYDYTDSPVGDHPLAMDSAQVRLVADSVTAELAKEKTDEKTNLVPGAAVASSIDAAAAAAKQTAPKSASDSSAPKDSPMQQKLNAMGAAAAASVTGEASFQGFASRSGGALDALTAIRYKTYGLSEMVQEKTRALELLEFELVKNLTFSNGSKARWQGNLEQLLEAAGPAFGVSGSANDAAYDWKGWFNMRFMPVFLNFATALAQATGKSSWTAESWRAQVGNLQAVLKGNDAVDVATAIYTTPGVWSQTASPWPGYTLNTEVRSIEANFQALKELAKKTLVPEQKAVSKSSGAGADNGVGKTAGDAKGGFWAGVGNTLNNVWQSVRSAGSAVGTGLYNATHSEPNLSMPTGGPARQLGEAGEGQYAELPQPKGAGKWEYFQELYEKIAKLTGVPAALLASMTAIESGFNPTVRAATSSATGLFQFISGTWKTMMRKYAAKYGIPADTPPTDPRANALLGALFVRENMQSLKGVKPELSDTDLYAAHFLGAGGAKTLLKSDPNAVAATIMPEAAKANVSIFYNRDGSPRTVAAVYAELNRRVQTRGKQFGLNAGTGSLPTDAAGGGRGSVNPEAADPNAPAGGGDASAGAGRGKLNAIPVSEQVAAPAVNTGTQPITDQPSAPSAGQLPSDVSPMGQGFQPSAGQRVQDVQQVQQAQREDMSRALGSLSDVSVQQLATQNAMLVALRSIEKLVATRFGSQDSSDTEQPSAAPSRLDAPAQRMPKPPVSMGKVNPAY